MRDRQPKSAHAGGYSVMYAVQGVGYSLSAILAGVVLDHASPSAAMLTGVALGLVLITVSLLAERRAPAVATDQGSVESASTESVASRTRPVTDSETVT